MFRLSSSVPYRLPSLPYIRPLNAEGLLHRNSPEASSGQVFNNPANTWDVFHKILPSSPAVIQFIHNEQHPLAAHFVIILHLMHLIFSCHAAYLQDIFCLVSPDP